MGNNMSSYKGDNKGRGKFYRGMFVIVFALAIFLTVNLIMVEKAESAGFNTPPPAGHSLLKDYFGVDLSLLPPHDGGNYYSF